MVWFTNGSTQFMLRRSASCLVARRWQASLAWKDPTATAVCLFLLVLLGASCAAFGFPTVLCTILFVMVRQHTCRRLE